MRAVSVIRADLDAALRVAQTATSRVLPILQCVRIYAGGDRLTIQASNGAARMDMAVTAAEVCRDPESCCAWVRVVSPRALLAALRLGLEAERAELRDLCGEDGTGEALEVVMGTARARIPSLREAEWPVVTGRDIPGVPQVYMDPGELRSALRGAVAAARDEAGTVLSGLHISMGQDPPLGDDLMARLTCTDGRRLHRHRVSTRLRKYWPDAAPQALIQGCDVPMAATWLAALQRPEDFTDVSVSDPRLLNVRMEPTALVLYGMAWGAEQSVRLPLMAGQYPAPDKVLPDWGEAHHRIVLEAKGLALPVVEALGAMVSADQETRATAVIELRPVAPGSLTISARPYVSRSAGLGSAGTTVSAHVEAIWPDREIPPVALDAAFLAEALQAAGSGEVTIEIWQDEGQTEIARPVTISTSGTLAVVMPMRT